VFHLAYAHCIGSVHVVWFGVIYVLDITACYLCYFDLLVNVPFRFVTEYFHESWRGYGGHVATVFEKLQHENFKNLYSPSREQFQGQGSLANGGAMRIAPMALFCWSRNYSGEKLVVCL
jgi:ADP-ribosylglycohydrolase